MKSAIEMEVEEVTEILNKYQLSQEDKEAVLNALKEMAYQWCQSNAGACLMEELVQERLTQEQYTELVKAYIHDTKGYRMQKMLDTYPDFGDDNE